MLRPAVFLFAACCCHATTAQGLYKCIVDGKVSYGQAPCAAGHSVELAVPAAPVPDPRAQQALERDKAHLAALQKQRHARELQDERQARRARPATAGPNRARCNKLRLQKKWLEEDLAKTAGPATEPLRLKVRRQAEALALECPA